MSAYHKPEENHIGVAAAMETLSNIAELQFEKEEGAVEESAVSLAEREKAQTVQWLQEKDPHTVMRIIKESLRVMLRYLKEIYKEESHSLTKKETVDRIKNIMVVVGEAAKKLEKYASFTKNVQIEKITDLKEYQQLQHFYQTKLESKIGDKLLKKIFQQTPRAKEEIQAALPEPVGHAVVDIASVTKDSEYELFFIRKEDGSRFFSPKLARNIKLVTEFGEEVVAGQDPLTDLEERKDAGLLIAAKNILSAVGAPLDRFYHEAYKYKNRDLVAALSKAAMALMLSANPRHLKMSNSSKNSTQYFTDFQHFLREGLQCRDYQRMIAYPPKRTNSVAYAQLDLAQGFCRAIFMSLRQHTELYGMLDGVIKEEVERGGEDGLQAAMFTSSVTAFSDKTSLFPASFATDNPSFVTEDSREGVNKALQAKGKKARVWEKLTSDYQILNRVVKRHSNGPLTKALELLEEGSRHFAFDPWMLHNLPNQMYDLHDKNHRISHIRLPSPTSQDFINKAVVTEEFKAFILSCQKGEKPLNFLLIDLQDRTSWKEHSRCVALEELQYQADFKHNLVVVSLPKDTDFYYQHEPYDKVNEAAVFIEQFKEHLVDDSSGFYFSAELKKKLFPGWADEMMGLIHATYFGSKNTLAVDERLNFIEIFYLLLQLKLVEVTDANSFSLTCKDGIDVGAAASAQLFVFLKLINDEPLSEDDYAYLDGMLFAPAITIRERNLLQERFNRMISALKYVDDTAEKMGRAKFATVMRTSFGKLFKKTILQAHAVAMDVAKNQLQRLA